MSSRSSKKTSARGGASGDTVAVGRVLRPHGVRGEAVVEPFSDVPERFSPGAELLAASPGTPLGSRRSLRIESARPHRGALLVQFGGVAGRDAVEELRGALLEVPREVVPEAPEDAWYHFDLVGCRCRDLRAGELGEVVEVVEDGGGVLLAVESPGRRLLVPFVREMVREVDTAGGRIELDLPEGLIEACASRS
ncbi:MAG TPA: ribosome maturation factor RimM [Thermoanaerobaculia bacterium]|nr:ribosome maturation factor RimM [Thermoanaerobaculia bacterium]